MRLVAVAAVAALLAGCAGPEGNGWRVLHGLEEYPEVVHRTGRGVFDTEFSLDATEDAYLGAYYETPVEPVSFELEWAWTRGELRPLETELRFPRGESWRWETLRCPPDAASLAGQGFTANVSAAPSSCRIRVTTTALLDAPNNGIALLWKTHVEAGDRVEFTARRLSVAASASS